MPTQKPTPEEKLFAVIQGESQSPIRGRAQALSLSNVVAVASAFLRTIDLPRANQALGVMVGVLGLSCFISPLLIRPRIDRLMSRAQTHAAPFLTPPLEGLRPIEDYLNNMAQQDPFRVGEAPVTARASTTTPLGANDPKTLLTGLKLVGIAWGEQPTAMVEEHEQTHFLRPGDTLGSLTVKEILKDRVVFRLGDQEVELF